MKKAIIALAAAFGLSLPAMAETTPPQFPGGEPALEKYLTDNMQYPAMAKDNGVEGVVCVIFTVKTDGSIGNIKIKRMVDPDLESEAIRLVKGMPAWTPASDNGTPVEAQADVDVNFTLE